MTIRIGRIDYTIISKREFEVSGNRRFFLKLSRGGKRVYFATQYENGSISSVC